MQTVETRLRVLVIEDDPLQSELLAVFVQSAGYDVVTAATGKEALNLFVELQPDVVLLDYELPDMSGKQIVEQLRQTQQQWLPILFLSAHHDVAVQRDCLKSGGDDYITKPLDFPILEAKMQALCRLALMQRTIRAQTDLLEAHIRQEEQEAAAAHYLYERLVTPSGRVYSGVHQWILPAQKFSGDMICSSIGANGHIYLLLADATGHGLSAAIGLIPVTQVFYSMTGKGHHLSTIAREMNRQVRQFTPSYRFVAAILIEIDPFQQQFEIWNGGMPSAMLWHRPTGTVRLLPSRHVAIGLDADHEFNADVEHGQYTKGDQLLAFSDGLVDAESPAGERFGMARIEQAFSHESGQQKLSRLQEALCRHRDDAPALDDIAMALIDLPDSRILDADDGSADIAAGLAPCELKLTLQDRQIAQFDLLPMAVEWMRRVGLPQGKIARLHTVLMELVTNAIDHGLLRLDSALKEQTDGFAAYFIERNQRLQALKQARLDVSLQLIHHAGKPVARIEISDSGPGFDHTSLPQPDSSEAIARKSGRGLQLVRLHCKSVTYHGNGNTVTVELDL